MLWLRLKKELLWVMFRVCGESLKVIYMSAGADVLAMSPGYFWFSRTRDRIFVLGSNLSEPNIDLLHSSLGRT